MRRASTVIPVRRSVSSSSFEILMVKRKTKARFMGGFYVFPGGVEEQADKDSFWKYSPEQVCGARELFEECGIFVGDLNRANLDLNQLNELRKASTADAYVFLDLCKKNSLNLEHMKQWSHWITPEKEKHRYDTTFFLLELGEKELEGSSFDNVEVTDLFWKNAGDILASHEKGEIVMAPPTWLTIKELARFENISEAMKSVRTLKPILPTLVPGDEGRVFVCLPGDELHVGSFAKKNMRRRIVMNKGKFEYEDNIGTHITSSI